MSAYIQQNQLQALSEQTSSNAASHQDLSAQAQAFWEQLSEKDREVYRELLCTQMPEKTGRWSGNAGDNLKPWGNIHSSLLEYESGHAGDYIKPQPDWKHDACLAIMIQVFKKEMARLGEEAKERYQAPW